MRLQILKKGFDSLSNLIYIFERMAEWLKATDCKSVGFSYVGSNPTSFTELI